MGGVNYSEVRPEMDATTIDLSSNVFGRTEQAGLRYDIALKLYWSGEAMRERHSIATLYDGDPQPKQWVFNDALRKRGGEPSSNSGEVEAGAAIRVTFHRLRAPSIIDAQRIALGRLAEALTEAELELHVRQPLYADATVTPSRET